DLFGGEVDLRERLVLAGPSDDVPAVMNGLDLHVLSSCAEGFPNVVAEAMACGAYCVATDVGDAAYIIGDTGVVVPPEQPEALARGIESALREVALRGRSRAGEAGRARVLENFDLARMVQSYAAVWRRLSGASA
ncbi:MAG: glycosyltransferase, partial [Achromobacter sp.]|nr:glycosyltransferase [Achromobacter sp.]